MSVSRRVLYQVGRSRALSDEQRVESAGRAWFRSVGTHQLDRAYRLAGFILGDAREAEDATQDAMLRAWHQRDSLRNLHSAQPWFDRILVNVCRDRLRRKRPRVGWLGGDDEALPLTGDPFAGLIARDAVLRGLGTLDPDHRIVLVLRFWADLSVDDIAERLDIPAGTVKSRLHYAMRDLRAAIGSQP
jgi:RNA polymerase sigma-70 factor (ECF subfamily)